MGADETRSALVRAGVELLEELGTADIGLREIARRAGVSHGAPRRYFPTHRALLAAIAEVGLVDLQAELDEVAAQSDTGVEAVARAYIAFAGRRPAMFTLIFRHDLLVGSGADLSRLSRPLFGWLVALVEPFGEASDAQVRAATLWVGVHGLAVLASTGALALAAPDVAEGDLIERIVRASIA